MSETPTGQDVAGTPPQPVVDRHWKLGWIITAILGGVAPFVWWMAANDEPGAFGAMVLLMMSSGLILCASLAAPQKVESPHGLICWGGALLEIWKIAALVFYYYRDAGYFQFIAYVAIALDVVLLGIALWFVRRVILIKKTQKAIRAGLFAVLCGVLALFMHVLYSCTFALAFHDRAVGDALHPNAKQWVQEVALGFREGMTDIDQAVAISDRLDGWPEDEAERRAKLKTDLDEMMKMEKKIPKSYAPIRREEIFEELSTNISSWRDVTETLTGDGKAAWRVTVVGYASDQVRVQEENTEWNNYILSQDRANNVYNKLREAMKKKSVRSDWNLAAAANADVEMGAIRFIKGRDKKLSARVFVEKQAGSLSLLDYLYFMTYTITTTGYGDLVPTTPFAKFITCIANLFEILFIVVIINLVFAYAKDA